MSFADNRTIITARIWQTIAQIGIDLSAIPKEKQEYLVNAITDTMVVTFDEIAQVSEQSQPQVSAHPVPPVPPVPSVPSVPPVSPVPLVPPDPPLSQPSPTTTYHNEPEEERVQWEGRPFLSIVESYIVTTERIRIKTGLLSSKYEDVELVRIQDIDFSQGFFARLINRGDIIIRSANLSEPFIVLRNIEDPSRVHEIIRRGMLMSRKHHGFSFQEEL